MALKSYSKQYTKGAKLDGCSRPLTSTYRQTRLTERTGIKKSPRAVIVYG